MGEIALQGSGLIKEHQPFARMAHAASNPLEQAYLLEVAVERLCNEALKGLGLAVQSPQSSSA